MDSLSDGQLYREVANSLAHITASVKELAERQGCGLQFIPGQINTSDVFLTMPLVRHSETCGDQERVEEQLSQKPHGTPDDSTATETFTCRREWESHNIQHVQSALMKAVYSKQRSERNFALGSKLSLQYGGGADCNDNSLR